MLVEPTANGQALRSNMKDVQAALACSIPPERAELKALHGTLTRLVAGLREAVADCADGPSQAGFGKRADQSMGIRFGAHRCSGSACKALAES